MSHKADECFVVVSHSKDGYSYDTSGPDKIFTSKIEAQNFADEMNKSSDHFAGMISSPYVVITLEERIYEIVRNSYDQGCSFERGSSC